MSATHSNFFVTGGTLRQDAPCYVERQADRDLLNGLLGGEFCYVLTSRQMGKSSLMVRAANGLRQRGINVITLDLTALGQNLTLEQWYDGLVVSTGRQLRLEDELESFWLACARLAPMQRWLATLSQVILPRLKEQALQARTEAAGSEADATLVARQSSLVIFVDEIDMVRSLPFSTNEFFAAIRECYNRRAEDLEFNRLAFCFLGVATPTDLIPDNRTTPFNIGRRIELNDFTAHGMAALAKGFYAGERESPEATDQAEALLKRVFHWTNGHPYLTQRLCRTVAEECTKWREAQTALEIEKDALSPTSALPSPQDPCPSPEIVDRACAALFLTRRACEEDDNLLFVRDRLLRSEVDLGKLLTLYARVLRVVSLRLLPWENRLFMFLLRTFSDPATPDDPANPIITVLHLSGLTATEGGCLRVRNRIYARVFDERWVKQHMPEAEIRRQRAAFWLGVIRTTSIAIIVFTAVTVLAAFALNQSHRAQKEAERATRMANESRQGMVRLSVAYGVRLMEEGDHFSALQQFIDALRLDQDDPLRAEMHRVRIAAVLQQCPKLLHIWWHTSQVHHAEFSPDGRWIVTAHEDGTARLWDTADGQPGGAIMQCGQPVNFAAFSPDSRLLATSGEAPWVKVWDVPSGQPVTSRLMHDKRVNQVSFSPDGSLVLTASADGTARLWNARSGLPTGTPLRHSKGVYSARFSPDGRRIVTASEDRTARVWDALSSAPVSPALQHKKDVIFATFSPDGHRVVTASRDHTGQVWDAETGVPVGLPLAHTTWLTDAQFSPDGLYLITTSFDGTAKIWDAMTGKPFSSPLRHMHSVMAGSFSPDGTRVITACFNQTAQVWDPLTGALVLSPLKHSGYVPNAKFAHDGRRILTFGADLTVRLWDMASGSFDVPPFEHGTNIGSAAFSPDGSKVVTASWDKTARLWDAVTGKPLLLPLDHRGSVIHASFSPDGRRVLTASSDGTARLWSAETGKSIGEPLQHRSEVDFASFSADGRRIFTGSRKGWACIWDAFTGTQTVPILDFAKEVAHVAFSPDGSKVAVASSEHYAQVWSTVTRQPLSPPMRHQSEVRHVAFSPDGRKVVTSCTDDSFAELYAQVWDAETGKSATPPLPHKDGVLMSEFSPDGRLILTSSEDGTAGLWDAETGKLTAPFLRHSYQVTYATFSPDSRRVVTASLDHTARVWDARTGEPVTPPLKHQLRVNYAAFSPDGMGLVTVSIDGKARLWSLRGDERPIKDLVRLAQLLNSREIAATGGVVPIEPTRLRESWQHLRKKYPEAFSTSAAAINAWHRQELEDCLKAKRWSCALHHLDLLVVAQPDDPQLQQLRSQTQISFDQDKSKQQ